MAKWTGWGQQLTDTALGSYQNAFGAARQRDQTTYDREQRKQALARELEDRAYQRGRDTLSDTRYEDTKQYSRGQDKQQFLAQLGPEALAAGMSAQNSPGVRMQDAPQNLAGQVAGRFGGAMSPGGGAIPGVVGAAAGYKATGSPQGWEQTVSEAAAISAQARRQHEERAAAAAAAQHAETLKEAHYGHLVEAGSADRTANANIKVLRSQDAGAWDAQKAEYEAAHANDLQSTEANPFAGPNPYADVPKNQRSDFSVRRSPAAGRNATSYHQKERAIQEAIKEAEKTIADARDPAKRKDPKGLANAQLRLMLLNGTKQQKVEFLQHADADAELRAMGLGRGLIEE